jgi:glycerophosphoryl diester phosphodiesterase
METKIIAHRGDTSNFPENTLSAFKAALDNGTDAIELDVHCTSDGELIVHHDYYLGNSNSGEEKIYEEDLAYIQNLKIGDTEKIPRLEEVFELIGDKLQYEIELKGFTEEFLARVIALVKKHGLAGVIEFTSPNVYSLTRIKTLEPSYKIGTFVAALPGWMDRQLGQTLAINNALLGDIGVLHCPINLIDKQFILAAHSKGLLVHAADCNTDDDLRAAFDMGVDQLSTDELGLAVNVRRLVGSAS